MEFYYVYVLETSGIEKISLCRCFSRGNIIVTGIDGIK